VLVDHREQVPARHGVPVLVGVPRPAQGLTVHREHAAPPHPGRGGAQLLDEPADRGVERIGVDDLHGAPDRGLARAPLTGAEQVSHG
jgi:hypothetical protein